MQTHGVNLLRLLQLADSALPIGGLAHSFGLETLIEEGQLTAPDLLSYFQDQLSECLFLDAVFCRNAHSRGLAGAPTGDLDAQLSARRPARESRDASLTLGRRFLALLRSLESAASIQALPPADESHFAVAFGYVGGALDFDTDATVGAFLHQNIAAGISVCQRLLPFGQLDAAALAWDLKPNILEATAKSVGLAPSEVSIFNHFLELSSMRHPMLPTRLFVS